MYQFTKLISRFPLYIHLPLFCAVLLESHIQFLMLKANSSNIYLLIASQLFIECLPFFVAHQVSYNAPRFRAGIIWFIGFCLYPLLLLLFKTHALLVENWVLLSAQGWLFITFSSVALFVNRAMKVRKNKPGILSNMFSLNIAIATLLIGWALVMAGVFNSAQVPKDNSLTVIIDITNIFIEFGQYLYYLWQFLFVSALLAGVYVLIRYGLIRKVLAKQGVLSFVAAALICIIVITPFFASLVLWLPLNQPHVILFPSADHRVFSPVNYQFLFWLFAITTPLILVFERQQQDTVIAQIAQQQTHTELKLLQQQINPHFLFNTLNNLYALTLTKSDDAPHLVMHLSKLLRYTVYEGQQELVTLEKEVAYLQNFVALQQIRSHDRCTLDLKWPYNSDKFNISPLLIIMLLENAFKYGVEPTNKQSHICFHMALDKNVLTVVCENPIFKNVQVDSGGLGLENLRRRLALLYPGKHTLHCAANDNLWQAKMTLELTPC